MKQLGRPKKYETVIIVPITYEMKDELKSKVGNLEMARMVRKLIEKYLEKENGNDRQQVR